MVAELLIQFTPAFLGGLAANLSTGILQNGLREVKKLFPADPEAGDPEKEALRPLIQAGNLLEPRPLRAREYHSGKDGHRDECRIGVSW